MKYLLTILTLIASCNNHNKVADNGGGPDTAFVTNDTIPEIRPVVNKKPVASYMISINNPLLEQFFGVKVYETKYTFQYLLKMQYEGMIQTDTLKIPNFGTWPVVKVKPSKEKLTCVIGFLEKNKAFKEYKLLTARGDKLKLKVLHNYFVGSYRTAY